MGLLQLAKIGAFCPAHEAPALDVAAQVGDVLAGVGVVGAQVVSIEIRLADVEDGFGEVGPLNAVG